jgi:predicted nucleotidyltransferase
MLTTSIGDALFTKTQQRVLCLLFGQPDKRFYANEIVRLAAMGRGTVRRELERMEAAGLLVMVREGKQHYYQANQGSPVFAELCGIVRKSFGVEDVLREVLQPLAGQIVFALVYGSMASGEEHEYSDIDLLIVGDISFETVAMALFPCQETLGREISPNVFSRSEFVHRLEETDAFLSHVLKGPKWMILGREDDLREFTQNQQTEKAGSGQR